MTDADGDEPSADKPETPWWSISNPLQNIDINPILDSLWEAVILGDSRFNPDRTCYDLVDEYRRGGRPVKKCVENFIDWQTAKAGVVGFLLGAPGFVSIAVSIPGDFLACVYLQMRAVAVIALMCGWDVKSDRVKTIALYSLVGGTAATSVANGATTAATKGATVALKNLPATALLAINRSLGFRFVTKFGTQGVVNLVDFIPIIGGLVSGSVNGLLTNRAGWLAFNILKDGPDSDIIIDVDLVPNDK
jgi:hypothetical protein